ncbi:hypothetical protein GCM10010411_74640 [Actinomadura fulvescens]|uniref:histidine kinase n=1 Tax=Actinomadura fulvescens TaxID=46160 RepID=A0ABP6CYF4_9ACTN
MSMLTPEQVPTAVGHAHTLAAYLADRGLNAKPFHQIWPPVGDGELVLTEVSVSISLPGITPRIGCVVHVREHPKGRTFWWAWPRKCPGPEDRVYFHLIRPVGECRALAAAIDRDLWRKARTRLAPGGPGAAAGAASDPAVLVHVGQRLHSLVSRTMEAMDRVERKVEDPDLLHDLFAIDHLVTLNRRMAERLAVLGGRTARRSRKPVLLSTVLRQAVAEVEDFQRVRVELPDTEVALLGHAGPDIIHLLAELVENATVFSPPHTLVVLRATTAPDRADLDGAGHDGAGLGSAASDGLCITVEDQGLSMSAAKLAAANKMLACPQELDPHEKMKQGQIGLLVVGLLAARHHLQVELRPHPATRDQATQNQASGIQAGEAQARGIQAVVWVPGTLLIGRQPSAVAASPLPALPGPPAPLPAGFAEAPAPAPAASATPDPRPALPVTTSPHPPPALPRRRPAHDPIPAPTTAPGATAGAAGPPVPGTAAPARVGSRPVPEAESDRPALPRRRPAPPRDLLAESPTEPPAEPVERAVGDRPSRPSRPADAGLMGRYTRGLRRGQDTAPPQTPPWPPPGSARDRTG